MLAIFLGAGFSAVVGVPLASRLFDRKPEVDLVVRQKLVDRVLQGWQGWHAEYGGTPEQYLAALEKEGGTTWKDAVWYVALAIALEMGVLQRKGEGTVVRREPRDRLAAFRLAAPNSRSYISHHHLNRTTDEPIHEEFWSEIFTYIHNVAVITTNYDILAERGLRHVTRRRARRPGFHYGSGPEVLQGRGQSWIPKEGIRVSGKVPLLKLHGSISWSFEDGRMKHYLDCRPALRGDACIIAPVYEKVARTEFASIWEAAARCLAQAKTWIVVGYSFPEYDVAVSMLFAENSKHKPNIHVFDPDPRVEARVKRLSPQAAVELHEGLPNGIDDLARI